MSRILTEVREPGADIRKTVSGRWDCRCKGPEMGWHVLTLKSSQELGEAGVQLREVKTGRRWA